MKNQKLTSKKQNLNQNEKPKIKKKCKQQKPKSVKPKSQIEKQNES